MKQRAATELRAQAVNGPTTPTDVPARDTVRHVDITERHAAPASREDAEARYVAARDAWTKAMRAANSGRPADLASLAIAQEAYEVAAAERQRWLASPRVAIPVEPELRASRIQVAIGQELEWRRVHRHEKPTGLLGRLKRRITG